MNFIRTFGQAFEVAEYRNVIATARYNVVEAACSLNLLIPIEGWAKKPRIAVEI